MYISRYIAVNEDTILLYLRLVVTVVGNFDGSAPEIGYVYEIGISTVIILVLAIVVYGASFQFSRERTNE